MIKIAIIVLNWNQPQLTLDTIDSLKKIKSISFKHKIFLIDNNSTDNSFQIFQKNFKSNPAASYPFLTVSR